MENAEIAEIFEEIGDLLDLKDANQFRIRSYRSAARTVRDLSRRIEDVVAQGEDLSELPNIGEKTADKIHEILEKGTCKRLEELREQMPGDLPQLMDVPDIGPRTAEQLHEELNVETLEELQQAAENEEIRELEGLGLKTEENILQGIETLESASDRISLQTAEGPVESIGRYLDDIDSIKQWEVAGSYRRRKETVGDLDIVVHSSDIPDTTDHLLDYDRVADVIGSGEEKVSVRLEDELRVDFRYCDEKNFGAALMYFTGSKSHSITLRGRAVARDWKLNEYGLFKRDHLLAARTEEAVFHRLNCDWIPPELREDRGEVQAAAEGELPDLVEQGDIRGDLQSHTDQSDGQNTLEEMAHAAAERGHEYLAITDHAKTVHVAQGLDEQELRKHAERIWELNEELDDIWLLAGIEVNIMENGEFDLDHDVLEEMDWVVAAVHSYLDLDQTKQTDRICKALDTGLAHCYAHPFERQIIGDRDPMQLDIERVFEVCLDNNVAVEINAQPDRLDLPDVHCKRAKELGLKLCVNTDAHKTMDLDFMHLGVDVARRGWLEPEDVINTLTASKLRQKLGLD